MNESLVTSTSSYERIVSLRHELTAAIGDEKVSELHRESLGADLMAAILPLLAGVGAFVILGIRDLPIWLVLCLVLFNGWLLTVIGLVAHDMAVHRVRWGKSVSWIYSALAFALVLVPATGYSRAHIKHHAKLGTANDSESYKMRVNSPLKRLMFATLPGFIFWTRANRPPGEEGYMEVVNPDLQTARRLKYERLLMVGLLIAAILYASFIDARQLVLGYLVPLAVVAPSLNAVRIVLEHAESDDNNRYWLGTNYRTGWVCSVLFLNGGGDCHVVHHVFPKIPFYRCRQAADLIRPYIAASGVPERTSFWALMSGWFVRGYAHRTPWPLPGTGAISSLASRSVSVSNRTGEQGSCR